LITLSKIDKTVSEAEEKLKEAEKNGQNVNGFLST